MQTVTSHYFKLFFHIFMLDIIHLLYFDTDWLSNHAKSQKDNKLLTPV